ncbi:MAG: long-chain-fatty-acid--CoA ligase [Thermodesulfobacteriota bacterium]
MNLSNVIDRAATYFPNKIALIFGRRSFTYEEIRKSVNRVAAQLIEEGLRPGDRVALYVPNSPEWVVAYYGIIRAGGVALCLNPAYKRLELEHLLKDAQPRLMIISEKLAANLPDRASVPGLDSLLSFELHPVLSTILENVAAAEPSTPVAVHTDADDSCVILYTGGTTGTPKGAMLTHRNLLFTAQNVCYHEAIRPDDRSLCFMPLNHVFGGNHIMNGIFYGCGTLILHDGFDLDRILASVKEDRVTRFFAVPTVFIRLLADAGHKRHFSTVKYCFSAATSMASEIVRKWTEAYGLTIHEAYGMTETSSLVTYNHMYRHRIGSVGTPAGIVEVRIVDPEGNPVPQGETGEIAIRGPNVMKGYWGKPEETSAMVRGGWLHSGDVGRLDRDGYLFIVDRIKDVIITGGYNVFPSEVEEVLYTHPSISECAVVGLEDAVYGEAVTAFVVLQPGCEFSKTELIAYCKERMASYKVPKEFKPVERLPKSSTGKILRRKIREAEGYGGPGKI